jgi:hypothetical protein
MSQSALRDVIWPEETALQTKLNGSRPELERTARFAKQTGLGIKATDKKKIYMYF